MHGEEIITINQGLCNKKNTITHIDDEAFIDLDKLQYNDNRCRMPFMALTMWRSLAIIPVSSSSMAPSNAAGSKPVLGVRLFQNLLNALKP
ncbi:MAG TPA: hypothetical protein VFH09_00780 [Nitrososphaera sp.]|nr:hypothetical protein [Nitrososphaera sp.]